MTVRKGISIFLFLVILVSGGILYYSVDKSSCALLWQANPYRLLLAMGLVCLVWGFDAFKLQALICSAGERIPFKLAIQLTWLNYFGCAITPMQGGGGPLQMYLLYVNGVSVGKSFAITMVRTLLMMFILGLTALSSLFVEIEGLPCMGLAMRSFMIYVSIFVLLIWCVVVISLLRPSIIKRFLGGVLNWLNKMGLLKRERVSPAFRYVVREIDAYNKNIRLFFSTGFRWFLLATLLSFFQMVAQFSVMPCLIWAMGLPVFYIKSVFMQALLIFLLFFVPTPGGSGAAEGGAAMIFKLFVPWNLVGMMAVGWRLLLEYTGVALGAIVAVRLFGWNISKAVSDATKRTDEDAV